MNSKPKMSHAARLDRLAEATIRVGANIQPGQEIILTATVEAMPLVRRITEHAYKAGASLVTTLLSDDKSTLARYRYAPDGAFDVSTPWLFDGFAKALENGAARIAVSGENPNLLSKEDETRVGHANKSRTLAYKPVTTAITQFKTNWTICSYASRAWAQAVFPELPAREAQTKLFDAIFKASRVDGEGPIANWKAHNDELAKRRAQLTAKNYAALRFVGPGTDLTVGLADGHAWCGGAATSQSGIICNANIPTEEVFTTPHAHRVNGYVSSTKPLAYSGSVIDGIRVEFKDGAIVKASAAKSDHVLQKMIGIDEGSRRLGEVALVPHSSPISASGILFYNTLYDENAACHIALGQSYRKPFVNWQSLSDDDFITRGANQSNIHVDWMIGSGEVNVYGITQSGDVEAVMLKGEWV
jgi:aminopeptidase